MTSALRESAGPGSGESGEADTGGHTPGEESLADLLAQPITAPPLRLAGDPDDDDGDTHICRGID